MGTCGSNPIPCFQTQNQRLAYKMKRLRDERAKHYEPKVKVHVEVRSV